MTNRKAVQERYGSWLNRPSDDEWTPCSLGSIKVAMGYSLRNDCVADRSVQCGQDMTRRERNQERGVETMKQWSS